MDINGISFGESSSDPKSPQAQYASDSARVMRTWRTRVPAGTDDEAHRYSAVQALIGHQFIREETVAATLRRWIERQTPHGYPAIVHADLNPAGVPYLYCTNVPRIEPAGVPIEGGLDSSGERSAYNMIKLEGHYNALPWIVRSDLDVEATQGPLSLNTPTGANARPDEGDALRRGWATTSRYIVRTRRRAPRVFTMRQGMVHFMETTTGAGDQKVVPEGFPFSQFRMAVDYTWIHVPVATATQAGGIPDNAIFNCSNGVNDTTFDGMVRGTLHYMSTDEDQLQSPLGNRLVNLTHHMIFVPNKDRVTGTQMGLNSTPWVKSGRFRWWQISTDGVIANVTGSDADTNRYWIFPFVDLSSLFRPDQT